MGKRISVINLQIVIEGETGQQRVDRATQAIHEALKRKCKGWTSRGLDVIRGLETFQDETPVDLASGGIATLTWNEYDA